MKPVPCINCITLPICRATYLKEWDEAELPFQFTGVEDHIAKVDATKPLTQKCTPLAEYIYHVNNRYSKLDEVNAIHRFMTDGWKHE